MFPMRIEDDFDEGEEEEKNSRGSYRGYGNKTRTAENIIKCSLDYGGEDGDEANGEGAVAKVERTRHENKRSREAWRNRRDD